MKNKAYSVLTIEKSFDDGEQRIIKGIASTPAADREGDIVDPAGITFQNPLPLLWQHNHDQPIGTVVFDRATPQGITFTATIAKVAEEGTLKTRCDEAWQSVKYQIVKGVSIGFRVLDNDYEVMKSGGLKFNSIEVYELSIVTVPANQEASIKVIKAFDNNEDDPNLDDEKSVEEPEEKEVEVTVIEEEKESFSEKSINNTIDIDNKNKGSYEPMSIAQQIKAIDEQLKLLKSNLSDVMQKSLEEQRPLTETESSQYDSIKSEIIEAEKTKARLVDYEKTVGVKAETEIKDVETSQHVSKSASWSMPAQPKKHVEKGVKFARVLKCLKGAGGDVRGAFEKSKMYSDTPEVNRVLKAMIETGATTNSDYSALVDYQDMQNEFIEFLRPQTIIGQLDGFRYAPFNARIKGQTHGAVAGFVGETQYKPVSSLGFNEVFLEEYKLAVIASISDELLRRSEPRIDVTIRNDLADAIIQAVDYQFISPLATGKVGVSPASVTSGATTISPSGTDGAALKRDITRLRTNLLNANLNENRVYLVMHGSQRMQLENLENAIGNPVFPELQQGRIGNIPVVTSNNAGNNIYLIKTDEIYLNQENIVLDTSREATLIMSDDPNNETGATPVNLWQTNQTAYRAEQYINWAKRRDLAVQVIAGANYGGDVTGK